MSNGNASSQNGTHGPVAAPVSGKSAYLVVAQAWVAHPYSPFV